MCPLALCLSAVALMLAAGAAGDGMPPGVVTCIPKPPSQCTTELCARVDPRCCASGKVVKCGCCYRCLIHLREGEQCAFFAPVNAVCGPGLVCGSSGKCVRKRPCPYPRKRCKCPRQQ